MACWWGTLRLIVEFLQSKRVENVHLKFGKSQVQSQTVPLSDLTIMIRRGFDEGTIEWAKTSDFIFHPLGIDLAFMLCNDADVHFASSDLSLVMELGRIIRDGGLRVYDSGKPI
jgi:hypothetical protein